MCILQIKGTCKSSNYINYSFCLIEVIGAEDDDAFNIDKLFPPKKHDWKKFNPNAHPWIGTRYSDSKRVKPWFIHANGHPRKNPNVWRYSAGVAGTDRYYGRYRQHGRQGYPYWYQQQYAEQQPRPQATPTQYLQSSGYQYQRPDTFTSQAPYQQQDGFQTQQQGGYQEQQPGNSNAQLPTSYQNPEPTDYKYQTAADYQGLQAQPTQTSVDQQYSTGFLADQSAAQSQQTMTTCPTTCIKRCTTACPEECCAKHFQKVAKTAAGPSLFVSDCPAECKTKCGIHCPQKCCGLNLCPFSCQKSCLPSCPKRCCVILKEFLPPLALPPLKLSAAICPNHCTNKCSTDCPQACCSKRDVPEQTTKCPSICLQVSIQLYKLGCNNSSCQIHKNIQLKHPRLMQVSFPGLYNWMSETMLQCLVRQSFVRGDSSQTWQPPIKYMRSNL